MRSDWQIYYGNPGEFEPVNAAYLQLAEEFQERDVNECCNYLWRRYPDGCLSKREMENAFKQFDIHYPLLPNWLAAKFDEFDIV